MRYKFLRFPEGKSKAVTLSYDDGCRQDIRMASIINRYGIKCTYNINSNLLGKDSNAWHLTKEEIGEHLIAKGHEIAVHGAKHIAPAMQRPIDGIQEVLNCRLDLEKMYGQIIRGMAYPDRGIWYCENGASYENIKHYLTDLGIAYARVAGGDNNDFNLPSDWHAWMPTAHHDNPNIWEYIEEFLALDPNQLYVSNRNSRLFYLWGHSFEFDRNDNWEIMEEICRRLGNKDDIWYATNIEIYDYVEAYNSLLMSADGTMIYNPTLITVWFDADGTLYKIDSDETICISEERGLPL